IRELTKEVAPLARGVPVPLTDWTGGRPAASARGGNPMQRVSLFVVLAFGAVACGTNVADEKRDKDKGEGKGTVVTLDGYSSRAPASWKQEKPSNEMRVTQFVLPRV